MGVLSKPLFSIIDGCFGQSGPRLVEGFNTKYGEDFRDVHFWCEDAHGKVYDTTPIPPHPSGSTQFAYLSWDNQGKCFDEYSNPAWESFFRVNKKLTDTPTARIRIAEAIFRVGEFSRYGITQPKSEGSSREFGLQTCPWYR